VVAAKECFSSSADDGDGDRSEFDNEVAMLVKLSHPNILQCFGTSEGPDGSLYQILEFCGGGTLQKYALESGDINNNNNDDDDGDSGGGGGGSSVPGRRCFTVAEFGRVVQEVLGGVAFLHERHVSHRDLKPDNILLLDDGPNPRVKIAGACVRSLID
jgi:serine/threonine protein kinase